jgi:surface carbohydrate biosynthesis protein
MSKPRKTILFTIEHKEREFLPKCFLAFYLAKIGFRVYIGSFQAIHEVAKKIGPAIFFHKSTYVSNSEYYRSLGHKFVVMDEEGGVTMPRSTIDEFCNWRYLTVSPKREDLILLPGRRYYEAVEKMENVKGVKIFTTGWPRVDLWQKRYSTLYEKEVNAIRKEHGRFYLVITSFGAGVKEKFSDFIKSSPDKIIRDIRVHKYNAFIDYVELINELSKLINRGEKIIVRPHPSEKISDWKHTLRGLDNVDVIRDGDITPWILSSESIVQYGSTTATQAALNGKVCVQYKIKDQKGVTDTPSFELCEDADTPEDVYKILSDKTIDTEKIKKRAIDVLKNEMATDESQLAVVKIADILYAEALSPVSEIKTSALLNIKLNIYYYRSGFKCILQRIPFGMSNKKTVWEKIPGGIFGREVSDIMDRFQSIENIPGTIINHI